MVKFLKCKNCGSLAVVICDKEPVMCCGEDMVELVANTTDGAKEKHVPVCTLNGNMLHVEVGSVLHPMTAEHLISTIVVVNGNKVQSVSLNDTMQPMADFMVDTDKEIVVYEYCNLHGLWKVDVK